MKKDMVFYGTSAAEGIPSPFCSCYLCRNAREKGGKDIRKRTMFRINDAIVIDLGADSHTQAAEYGDFIHLEHALITHTHEDHFAYMMMGVRKMAMKRIDSTLNYYLTGKAYDIVDFFRNNSPVLKGSVRELEQKGIIAFHKLDFYREYSVGNIFVTPLKGNHHGNMGEESANFIIRLENGKKLFYGLDTGYYLDETFEALKNYKLDYYISECTYGNRKDRPIHPDGHLDLASCMLIFHRLLEQGTIDKDTEIFLTHISHNHTATHADLVKIFSDIDFPCKITVAYDGMQIV